MLENETIKLRALETTDIDHLYAWENAPANWRVSHTITPFSRHALIDYIHTVNDIYTDKQLRLIIIAKATGNAIGTVDLFECDFKNRRAGIGVLIADEADRGKGYASAVLDVLLPYCFKVIGFHQVYCNILSDNAASLALFGKYGFVKVGVKREWTYHNGNYIDEVLMQKINTDG